MNMSKGPSECSATSTPTRPSIFNRRFTINSLLRSVEVEIDEIQMLLVEEKKLNIDLAKRLAASEQKVADLEAQKVGKKAKSKGSEPAKKAEKATFETP